MAHHPPGRPRWPALLALAAGVLGAHLLLLAGGVRMTWPKETGDSSLLELSQATLNDAPGTGDALLAPPRLNTVAMNVSTVRWIAPPAPPLAGRSAAPLPTAPAPTTPPTRPDQAPALANAIQVVGPAAVPEDEEEAPAVAAAPPPIAERPDTAPTPLAAVPPPEPQPPTQASAAAAAEAPPDTQPPVDEALVAAAGTTSARAPASNARAQPPAQLPASVRLGYDIRGKAKGLSYSADAQLQWQVEGPRYTAELDISAFLVGSRVQTSQGSIGPQGLLPLRFGDRRRGSEKAAHFDHVRQLIRFSNNAPDAPLQAGAQDRLSVFLQLGALLQARPQAYPDGSTIAVQVASTGGAEVWQFQVGALQSLTLPAGTVVARRLLREPRRDHDSTVEIWLAPSLQHLPVRIRVTEGDGSVADQLLRQLPPLRPMPTEATQ